MSFKDPAISIFREIIQTALVSLAIFFLVYTFLVQPHRVRGDSMMPNFADSELLLTEKVGYRFDKPQRGDVVVFKAPSRNVDYIKRIIGLPGETIKIENGIVFVNAQKLAEPYETQLTQGAEEVRLGENQYFVLGDNRGSSSDSRSFGPIDKNSIKGRVWFVYWPFLKTKAFEGLRIVSRIDYSVSDTLYNR